MSNLRIPAKRNLAVRLFFFTKSDLEVLKHPMYLYVALSSPSQNQNKTRQNHNKIS